MTKIMWMWLQEHAEHGRQAAISNQYDVRSAADILQMNAHNRLFDEGVEEVDLKVLSLHKAVLGIRCRLTRCSSSG